MLLDRRRWLEGSAALALLAAVGAGGCGGGDRSSGGVGTDAGGADSSENGSGLRLTGAGATFPNPLYSKWFSAYHEAHSDVTVNYQPVGSGGGIQNLKNGTVDFGASDAPLTAEEEKEMPGPVVTLPTAGGAVVLAYNLSGGPEQLQLSPEAIAGIFLGTITKWNDPRIAADNPGITLPDTAIAVAHRSDGSGTSFIFTNYLASVSPEWQSRVGAAKSVDWPVGLGGKGNEGVTGIVKQTPGAIGYVELAYAEQNRLKYASVKNHSGQFVKPSVQSTTAAAAAAADALTKDVRASIVNQPGSDAYPISGLTFILLFQDQKDAAKGPALVELLRWCMTDGQKSTTDLHYAPLPESLAQANLEKLDAITVNGQPVSPPAGPAASEAGGSSTGSAADKK